MLLFFRPQFLPCKGGSEAKFREGLLLIWPPAAWCGPGDCRRQGGEIEDGRCFGDPATAPSGRRVAGMGVEEARELAGHCQKARPDFRRARRGDPRGRRS
jgi:hypothetical protein